MTPFYDSHFTFYVKAVNIIYRNKITQLNQGLNMVSKVVQFLTTDIWRIRSKDLSRNKSIGIRYLRAVLLAIRGFKEDNCFLRASALTFFTLLSIVPLFAMAFGIAKGFGFEKMLEEKVMTNLQGQEEAMTRILDFSKTLLENTSGGIVAGIGVAFLFWTVIKMLGNIEHSFNDIWGIKTPRTLARKFSDYLSFMLICPLLFILSSSITVFVTSQIEMITQKVSLLGFFSPVIFTSLKLFPYCVLWVLFTFIYVFMPNTKVNIKSGLIAAIIAGSIYQAVQFGYIHFQIGVGQYGAIYGSFAALPLFLIWLQLSWVIVLLGCEIAFAVQNEETYEFESDCLKVSLSYKKLISLWIVHACVKRFSEEKKPLTATELSHALELPIRLIRQVVFDLTQAGMLSETKTEDSKVGAYQPGCPVEMLTVRKVLDALDDSGVNNIPTMESDAFSKLSSCVTGFRDVISQSDHNLLLKDI